MKKLYMFSALALALGMSMSAEAVERPKTPAGMPEDGGKYILVNAYSPTGYMSRTSWDGALYFLGKDDSNYANHEFTAKKNDDGTWSFCIDVPVLEENEEGMMDTVGYEPNYAAVPINRGNGGMGDGNLNYLAEPANWTIAEGDIDGFYHLIAGEGNFADIIGLKLHLNGGGQYFVISDPVNGVAFYPDYAGGAVVIPEEEWENYDPSLLDGSNRLLDENGRCVLADHTSENWAFIKVEDVPEHMGVYSAYSVIANYEKNYVANATEEYAAGFNATLTAVEAIYTGPEFNWDLDVVTIEEMVNAKVNFYKAIEEAKLIEDADDVLLGAIDNAMTLFASATAAADVENALTTLQTAVKAFKEGTGDLTSLGVNMSFEDLSAQGGSMTSGVAAPPYGWTVIVNGDTVRTAEEVTSHGIANWHGVNNDCSGTEKDGNYGFGLWTNGVPEYQISQTITGLENGTYVIKAALMVGANGSGSRRTTQRIFGNLNSTYFASEFEYDATLLDKSEIYAFQNNAEPTTDTEMLPIEVRAYVYDGTLTFGLRTNGNTAAAMVPANGGAGWFKIDNFRIQKVGYVGEDAAQVANYFIGTVGDLSGDLLEVALIDKVDEVLAGMEEVDADTDPALISNIITTLPALIPQIQASIAAYTRLEEAIAVAYEQADEYYSYAGYLDYVAVIEEAEAGYDDGIYTAEQIEEVIKGFGTAFVDLQMSGSAVGAYMEIIQNPGFEDLSAQGNVGSGGPANAPAGWTLTLNGVECKTTADYAAAGASLAWCAINGGDPINDVDEQGTPWTTQYSEGEHLWGIWAQNVPEVELSQSFTGVPKGTYILSCDLVCPWDWAGDGVTTQRIFANDYVQMYSTEDNYVDALNVTEDMAAAMAYDAANPDADLKHMNYAGYVNTAADGNGASRCPHPMSLKFGVDESGVLKLGFRTNNIGVDGNRPHDGSGWFKLDNFKLFYESDELPTSIGGVESSDKLLEVVGQKFYTIDGREVAQPQKGVNIIKNIMSDGSVKAVKVLK